MAIGTDIVARKYLNPVEATPISVDIPAFEEDDIKVLLCESDDVAVQDTDYTIALNASTYADFTITPTASMRTKIDALVADGQIDQIVVRRELDMLSDMVPELAFFRQKIATEFDKTSMRFQQLAEKVARCLSLSETDLGSEIIIPSLESLKGKFLAVSVAGDVIGSDGTTDTPISSTMEPFVSSASLSAARTALGLGSAATSATTAFDAAGSAAAAIVSAASAAALLYFPKAGGTITGTVSVTGNKLTLGTDVASSTNSGQLRLRDDRGAEHWISGIPYSAASDDYFIYDLVNTQTRLTINSSGYLTVPGVYASTTASAGNVFVSSAGLLQRSTSSQRYKNDVQTYTKGLDEVMKLRPVTYRGNNDGERVFAGLIAEEVDALGLSEFVEYEKYKVDGQDALRPDALMYGNMVALLVAAIQELKDKNDALETRVTELSNAL